MFSVGSMPMASHTTMDITVVELCFLRVLCMAKLKLSSFKGYLPDGKDLSGGQC